MSTAENLTERLSVEWQCRDVVLQSIEAVDARDYAAFAALFTEDATLIRPGGHALVGREAIQAAYAARDPDRLTQHLACNHRVRLQPDGTVHSRCRILLWAGKASDPSTAQGRPADSAQQIGEMIDTLIQTKEGWRIARREACFHLYRV